MIDIRFESSHQPDPLPDNAARRRVICAICHCSCLAKYVACWSSVTRPNSSCLPALCQSSAEMPESRATMDPRSVRNAAAMAAVVCGAVVAFVHDLLHDDDNVAGQAKPWRALPRTNRTFEKKMR